ncbi:MAG: DUF721 domain-containing protein [Planctomycetaceae bacterium]
MSNDFPREKKYQTKDPATLSESLSELFARRGYGRVLGNQELVQMWEQVAGPALAKQTRVRNLRNGVLEIAVRSSALLSQLVSFQQDELLSRIQQDFAKFKVRSLKFKLQGNLKK